MRRVWFSYCSRAMKATGSTVRMNRWRACVGSAVLAAQTLLGTATIAATVPAGFVDSRFVDLPPNATAMQFAPDGRLFVCQQSGQLRVVLPNGTLLATPFMTLDVDGSGERGLLGVAFDPQFETNGYLYVYYTAKTPTVHNRVSRFTASGNLVVPGSEFVLLDLTPLSKSTNHNGGAIQVGNLGKLLIATGDNDKGGNAQNLGNLLGKILRINRDGSIPSDNPFYRDPHRQQSRDLRPRPSQSVHPAVQHSTGLLFINDVGERDFEEINIAQAGANFGWPIPRAHRTILPTRLRFTTTTPQAAPLRPLRDHRWRLLSDNRVHLPAGISQGLLLRRFLRGVDPQARPGHGHRPALCQRHRVAGRPQGWPRRRAQLSDPRGRRACRPHQLRRSRATLDHLAAREPHGGGRTVDHFHGRRYRQRAAGVPVAPQRHCDRRCHRFELHPHQRSALGQRRALRRRRLEPVRLGDERQGAADGHQNSLPTATITQPASARPMRVAW